MLMKKIILRLLIALVVVAILAVLAVGLFLDKAIKSGVETLGPRLTKVDIKLQSVSLSLLSGSGTIKGLVVGNPEGYQTPSAINVGEASLALKPSSLLSDKVIIKSIKVQGPEITFETDLKNNNLSKILSNVQKATGGGQTEPAKPQEPSQPKEAKPAKKLQVDEFIITGGKIRVSVTALGGGSATVPLPDIHLQDLGTGPDGITPAELTQRVLDAIQQRAKEAASGAVADIGQGGVNLAKDAANAASSNAVEKVTKGIGGFFKKK
jgi:uncharacterized protein involved in outer membrane biogenesis